MFQRLTTGKKEKVGSLHVPAIKFRPIGKKQFVWKVLIKLKNTVFVNMWKLGQFHENLIFSQ